MKTVTLKDKTTIDVIVRNANEKDIYNLLFLNRKWQKVSLKSIKDGYIGAEFSESTFNKLIQMNQVSCAYLNDQIIGYYLLNNVSKDGIIGRHEDIVTKLKNNGKLPEQLKICVGAQAVVDTHFMGSGIRVLMLEDLNRNMKGKYEYLFATIAKDNPRAFSAHTRDGWVVIDEDESQFFVLFKV
jgi:hypothetical protein